MIRRALVPQAGGALGGGRWSLLGQSFGGFCCATYLSLAPEALTEVLMTGVAAGGDWRVQGVRSWPEGSASAAQRLRAQDVG